MNCLHRHLLPALDFSARASTGNEIVARCADCPRTFTRRDAELELGLRFDALLGPTPMPATRDREPLDA
jgi:hypothetical protein